MWIFNGGLQAYQRFDKARLVGFIQVQLFENLLRILFIFTGRYLGTLYPQVGELMGAVVGSLIGLISRDFLSAWLSAHWLSQVLCERVDPAFKIRDLFKIEFGKDVAIRCISYGLRAMVPGLISPMANFISVLLIVTYLPNYSSIVGMYQLGSMLSQMITTFTIDITPTVSEAYNNGKKVLTEYYIARSYTWTMINGTFILGLLFGGAELLGVIAGENFFLAVPIIQTLIFFRIGEMYAGLHDGIFHGVGKPELNILLIAAEQTVRVLILLVMLVGAEGGWLALVLSQGFGWIAKWVAGYVVFNLKVMHLTRINPWQSFVAPAIATLAEVVYILVMKAALYPLLIGILGNVAAAIVAVVIGVLTGPFFIYFPVYSAVGGWDEESLQIVACATRMAGPSKPLVNIIYKLSLYVTRVSPLHARFPTDIAGVQDEIDSLMRIRDRR